MAGRSWRPSQQQQAWGSDDDDGSDDDMKDRVNITGPDEDGVKTYDIIKTNEDGKKIRVKRKTKLVTKTILVNKNVARRRKLRKFGDCEGKSAGPEEGYTQLASSFPFILRPRTKDEAEKEEEEAKLNKIKSEKSGVAQCRFCGESGHFSMRCPKRDTIEVELPVGDPSTGGSGGREGRYVPPVRRGGGAGRGIGLGVNGGYADEYKIRITNISQDAQDSDIRDLFREFGHITRVYLAKDRYTNLCRGFAFVSFSLHADAERAVEVMNGHGYDNLILRVEHAKPREEDVQRSQAPGTGYNAFVKRRDAQRR
jgi:translation initiation factor 3 subunit G